MQPAYKKFVIGFWALFLLGLIGCWLFFFLVSRGWLGYMPSFEELENPKNSLATEIYSSDGVLLGKFFVENRSQVDYDEISKHVVKALVATEDERFFEHAGIDIRSLGRVLIKTVVLRQGESGGGSTITQQLAKLLFHERALSTSERVMQKLNEWVVAVKLERTYTKEEIIALYLNRVGYVYDAYGIASASYTYFGKQPADLKVEEAAVLVGMLKNPALYNPVRRNEKVRQRRNVVFGQMVKKGYISQHECDSLSALPLVLDFRRSDHKDGLAPYLREYIRLQMKAVKPERANYASWQEQEYKDDSIAWATNPIYGWVEKNRKTDGSKYDFYRDGLKIYTTIDSRMQKYAEDAVKDQLGETLQPQFFQDKKGKKNAPYTTDITKEQFETLITKSLKQTERWRKMKNAGKSEKEMLEAMKKPVETKIFSWDAPNFEVDTVLSPWDSVVYHKHILRTSFMAMEPQTGYVKAYVGGPNFRFFQYDMAGKGRRQVGSTIKPFVYTTIMNDGHTPCDLAPNVPQTFIVPAEGNTTTTWTPRNSGNARSGEMVSLKWGLANSNNNITGWVMKQTSPHQVARLIKNLGIESRIDEVPSLFLGTSEVKLLEMVGAYATYVNKGIHIDPIMVTRIEDKYGNVITRSVKREREVLDEQTAFMMVSLMQGVVDQGTGRRLRGSAFKMTAQMGGKTGTTQNQSDGWFMCVLPHLACGAWVGGEERAIHFQSMNLGQGANTALPLVGKFLQRVFADESIPEVKQTDTFEQPSTIQFSLSCSDKGVNADEGEQYAGEDIGTVEQTESQEDGGDFNF